MNKLLVLGMITLFLLAGCQLEQRESLDSNEFSETHITSLGFREEMIEDYKDFYLVEGDIIIQKSSLSRQACTTNTVADFTDITVRVDASIPTTGVDNWRTEISQALSDWNNISGSDLNFRLITSGTADITIRSDNGVFANNVIAAAEFPSSGYNAGHQIRINLDFYSNLTVSSGRKRYNMVHELGHCIGLRHTNWVARGESTAIYIPDTPATDTVSIMNGGTALNSWVGFSAYDIVATRAMYPDYIGKFYLRSLANNKLVCAENAGSSDLIANRTAVGAWEIFDLMLNNDGTYSFRTHANYKYVCAEAGGSSNLITNRNAIGNWEKFNIIYNNDGSNSYSIRAVANNLLVCAEDGGASPLIANRSAIGLWEKFKLTIF